jgi:hypothetical protein
MARGLAIRAVRNKMMVVIYIFVMFIITPLLTLIIL